MDEHTAPGRDVFDSDGWLTMLVGQKVAYRRRYCPDGCGAKNVEENQSWQLGRDRQRSRRRGNVSNCALAGMAVSERFLSRVVRAATEQTSWGTATRNDYLPAVERKTVGDERLSNFHSAWGPFWQT